MPIKHSALAPSLSPELRRLLVDGPPPPYNLHALPSHDELRAAWARHGAAILASLPPRVVPWFIGRDRFVRDVRREP